MQTRHQVHPDIPQPQQRSDKELRRHAFWCRLTVCKNVIMGVGIVLAITTWGAGAISETTALIIGLSVCAIAFAIVYKIPYKKFQYMRYDEEADPTPDGDHFDSQRNRINVNDPNSPHYAWRASDDLLDPANPASPLNPMNSARFKCNDLFH